MKKKLQVLWFGLVPLCWFLTFRLILWISNYPIDWSVPSGLGMFLILSGIIGVLLFLGSFVLVIYLQD